MTHIILVAFALFAIWLIKRDTARRYGISKAVWIPTIWVGILASRPVSAWLGFGGGEDTLEGSPADRLFFFGMIVAAMVTLSKRRVNWSLLISENWPVFLFYAYLLVSVLWAESPFVSFKRWFKETGNIFVLLVILTEVNPQQAFRAVFVRCAYVLIPLSIIFIRYFPDMGRRYNIHSGGMEAIGVTFQKNSLGVMVLICSLVLIWDWLERSPMEVRRLKKWERYLPGGILLIGLWLLHLSDSKTSITCYILGTCVLAASRLPLLRKRIGALGGYALAGAVGFFVLDWLFGIKEEVVQSMGRDMTFTGRTNVWNWLLSLKTDPVFGTGFCSFWSDRRYMSQLPDGMGASAHNGYLETYIDGGIIGVLLLVLMLIVVGLKINRQLPTGGNYALVRFAVFIVTVVGNFSESHFGRMSPVGFMFLLCAVELPWAKKAGVVNDVVRPGWCPAPVAPVYSAETIHCSPVHEDATRSHA